MSELNQANLESAQAALRAKLPDITASLNQCFDSAATLEIGEAVPLSMLEQAVGNEPGVLVSLNVGKTVMLCAIAKSLPLPAWYSAPNVSQKARLDTLALEWSLNCLPDELAPEKYATRAVPNLVESIRACQPVDFSVCLSLTATAGETPAAPRIWVVWPVAQEPADLTPVPQMAVTAPAAVPIAAVSSGVQAPPSTLASRKPLGSVHTSRLLNLPVKVIVKLAEKKVELGQLSGLGPGAIVTFDKSCEDLLDLYVNNQLYCRGEAVKIGEKFGIKITEIGTMRERVSAVLQPHGR